MENNNHILVNKNILRKFTIRKFLTQEELHEIFSTIPKDCDDNEKILNFIAEYFKNINIREMPGATFTDNFKENEKLNDLLNVITNNIFAYLKSNNIFNIQYVSAICNALLYIYDTKTIPHFDFITDIKDGESNEEDETREDNGESFK
jgi:hypothetical protein